MNGMRLYYLAKRLYFAGVPVLPRIIYYFIFLLYNSIVPFTANIAANTRLAYGGIGVVIHAKATIGQNCVIGQNVTVGGNFYKGKPPVIGDNVFIAPGARILGISVGNNVIIGANSVVLSDVPDNAVVVGSPARVIKSVEDIFGTTDIYVEYMRLNTIGV